MVPYLYTARDHHNARSPEEYAAKHLVFMQRQQAAGSQAVIHESPISLMARVDHNTWLVDCECGAGNAAHPDWPDTYCFACGAIHRGVIFPSEKQRVAIEAALLDRVRPALRTWLSTETAADLITQNATLSRGDLTPRKDA